MGRKKRVMIVGLPKFAARLASVLSEYCPDADFKAYDTYYSFRGKVMVFIKIFSANIVYSINGAIDKSYVFDLALALRKKLVMHWVGTDVLKSLNNFRRGNFNQKYIDKSLHLCEVEWIKEELKPMGINAQIQNFVSFASGDEIPSEPAQFNVLTYFHPGREKFYGIEAIIKCAESFPTVSFLVAGSSGYNEALPSNIRFLGWIDNLGERIREAALCIRFPEHDGLSSFVLESLSASRHVAYSYAFPHCIHCKSDDDLLQAVKSKYESFKRGESLVNIEGEKYIRSEFNREKILGSLVKTLGIA